MQKRHDILIGLCTCLLLFAATHVFAQQNTNTPRPKVGLVLSGGGAKGFAHIGVLKVLEASGVAVDYTTNLYYALLLCGCPNLRNQSGAKLCGKNLYGC